MAVDMLLPDKSNLQRSATMLRNITLLFAALVFSGIPASDASADSNSQLYACADQYRDAVREFERVVVRSRDADRTQRRAADDLEEKERGL